MNLHPQDTPEVNFTGLTPGELRSYFTLTRRAETPHVTAVKDTRGVFAPQTVHIPEGVFLMGSTDDDKNADKDEKPHHLVKLPEYFIGKYPISNAEYRAFVRTANHPSPAHWEGDAYPEEKGDHPVVNVSWHDAMAFCKWLSNQTGKSYRLPTEAEWEKAARGTHARIYPWGNDWDKTKANSREGGPRDTTPVGQYSPAGDSPYGAADMAGNVWEWTSSLWGKKSDEPDFKYPYRPDDGRENLGAGNDTLRVLRGGSFVDDGRYVRCACRGGDPPDGWGSFVGFRVVLSPFSSGL